MQTEQLLAMIEAQNPDCIGILTSNPDYLTILREYLTNMPETARIDRYTVELAHIAGFELSRKQINALFEANTFDYASISSLVEKFPFLLVDEHYAKILHRIEKDILTSFSSLKIEIMELLATSSPHCPKSFILRSGLFDSIMQVFLRSSDTEDKAVRFLYSVFSRTDAEELLPDLIMSFVLTLNNMQPLSLPVWRLVCFVLSLHSALIESITDFDSIGTDGMPPIFTRSLMWLVRAIVRNPPEKQHEPLFWDFLLSVTRRLSYSTQDKGHPDKLYRPLFGEICLSVFWALKTSLDSEDCLCETASETVKLLPCIDPNTYQQVYSSIEEHIDEKVKKCIK